MSKTSTRKRLRQRRRQERIRSRIIWGIIALGVVVVVAALIWQAVRPAVQPAIGEAVAIMPDSHHVAEGTDPGPYNSDPPTSGPHYGSQLFAGFYDADQAADYQPYPSGYLIHSLEHGYVIFWYNCELLDEAGCEELKGQIGEVIDRSGNFKVIGFPWNSIDTPVAATSWGRLMRFEIFDVDQAIDFVRRNRNQAPEPNAP